MFSLVGYSYSTKEKNYCCLFSSSNMASSSSVRLASMLPMSLSTSAGSCLWAATVPTGATRAWGCAGPGEGWGGSPARPFGDGLPVLAAATAAAALVLMVPAFSLANGRESDSVLELDCNDEGFSVRGLKSRSLYNWQVWCVKLLVS